MADFLERGLAIINGLNTYKPPSYPVSITSSTISAIDKLDKSQQLLWTFGKLSKRLLSDKGFFLLVVHSGIDLPFSEACHSDKNQ